MNITTITISNDGQLHCDWPAFILNEIADPVMKRKQVAHTYGILIHTGHREFTAINQAILARWSPSGLNWIKTQAWRWVETGVMPGERRGDEKGER